MKKVIFITLMLIATMAATSFAQPGSCDGPRGGKGAFMGHGQRGQGMDRLLMMADKLDLTDAQQEKLEKLRFDFKMEMVDTRAELQKAKIELKALMHNDDASTMAVNSAIDDVAGKEAEVDKLRFAHRDQAQDVLTDDQQAKLKELRLERRNGGSDKEFGKRHGRSGKQRGQRGQRSW